MKQNKYLRHEIKNLGRFISVAKLRPILWRNAHPYLVCDKIDDLTDSEVFFFINFFTFASNFLGN